MKKKKLKNKLKNNIIAIPMSMFKKVKTPIPIFEKAGRKVFKGVKEHFTKKGHGWPLSYSLLVSDIFYQATGHDLENYLLKCIANSNLGLEIMSGNSELLIKKTKKQGK